MYDLAARSVIFLPIQPVLRVTDDVMDRVEGSSQKYFKLKFWLEVNNLGSVVC